MSKQLTKVIPKLVKRTSVAFSVTAVQAIDGRDYQIEFTAQGEHISRERLEEINAGQLAGDISNADILRDHIHTFAGFVDEDGKPVDSETIKQYVLDDAALTRETVGAYSRRILGIVEGNSPKSRRG